MSGAEPSPNSGRDWPADKLSALRLGRRLVTEVPATDAGLRAFVDVTPLLTRADSEAAREGWTRADPRRAFRLQHREYYTERLTGLDYDIGSVVTREVIVTGEDEMIAIVEAWQLRCDQFLYPWQTDDPR